MLKSGETRLNVWAVVSPKSLPSSGLLTGECVCRLSVPSWVRVAPSPQGRSEAG